MKFIEQYKKAVLPGLALASALYAGSLFAQDPTLVQVGSVSAPQGAEIVVPVTLVENNHDATDFGVTVAFDNTLLELRDGGSACGFIEPGPALDESPNGHAANCDSNAEVGDDSLFAGVIPFPIGPATPMAEGVHFFIRFTVIGDPADSPAEMTIAGSNMGNNDGDMDPSEFEFLGGQVEILDVAAVLNVQPPSLDFETQQTGTTSAPQSVTVSNDGTDGIDLEITSIDISGDFDNAGGSCSVGTSLSDGDTCSIDVTFSPTADGAAAGTLTVGSDAGETTNGSVALSGEGIPTDANLVIDPDAFDFGPLDIDAPEACAAFALTNDNAGGNNSLTIGSASIAAPFTVTGNCDGETLAPGGSCEVEVCFDPDEEGSFTEALSATSDVNDASASVSGEGTAEANVTVSPPFGPVNLGVGEAGEVINASGSANNSGSADAELSCTASGDTGVITTDPSPLAGTVPANGSLPFSISCALPEDGEEGDEFNVTLSCNVDGEFAGEHEISCGISTFEPLPVPTMQTWALVLFALLMLLAGGIGVRYFRTH
jgi:hypothetical protein